MPNILKFCVKTYNKRMKLIVLLILFIQSAFAESLFENRCNDFKDIKFQAVECFKSIEAILPLKIETLSGREQSPGYIRELILYKELETANNELTSRRETWGNFKRYLEGTEIPHKEIQEYQKLFQAMLGELELIQEAYDAHKTFKAKLDYCYLHRCSIAWQLELEDLVKALEKHYHKQLADNPLWVSEGLEEFLDKPAESRSPSLYLKNTLAQGFQRDDELARGLQDILASIQKGTQDVSSSNGFSLTSRENLFINNQAIDFALNMSLRSWEGRSEIEKKILCDYIASRTNIEDIKSNIRTGGNITFTAMSFLPLIRAPKTLLSSSQVMSMFGRIGLVGSLATETLENKAECAAQNAAFLDSLTSESYKAWKACNKKTDFLETATFISALPIELFSWLPKAFKKIGDMVKPGLGPSYISQTATRTEAIVEHHARHFDLGGVNAFNIRQGDYTYIYGNLGKLSDDTINNISIISDNYLDYVGNIYVNKLKLLPEDKIQSFIRTSKEYKDRTKLIVLKKKAPTENNPDSETIVGGVAAVESRNSFQPLPLERSTGITLPRTEGSTIVEITRLVSTEPKVSHMEELLKQISALSTAGNNVSDFYVYTSGVHMKLYQRLFKKYKIKVDTVETRNPEEIIYRIDASQVERALVL